MRDTRYLLLATVEAAAILTVLLFALALTVGYLTLGSGRPPATPSAAQIAALAVVILLPPVVTGWWLFRRARGRWQRRESLAVAVSFGVFAPVPLAAGLLLGPIIGGYAGIFLRTPSRLVAFSGAVIGIVVMIGLVTFVTSMLAVWITRHIGTPRDAQ